VADIKCLIGGKVKRTIAIIITVLFLSQVFGAVQWIDARTIENQMQVKGMTEGLDLTQSSVKRAENGLVAQWLMDEGTGTNVGDNSGNGNDGTMNNMDNSKWVEGMDGKALKFDGSDDYVKVDDAPTLDMTDEITIEAWVKLNELNRRQCFVGKRHGVAASQIGYLLKMGDDNSLALQFNGFGYNAGILKADVWQHVAGTYDGSTINLYINGVNIGSENHSGSITSNNAPVYLGAFYYSSFTNLLNGELDEIAIYNKAMTKNEIAQQYQRTKNNNRTEQDSYGGSWFDDFEDDSGIEGGLGTERLEADEHTVGLWHFDEGTGNEAKDVSGNVNDGTLTNMEEEDWVEGKNGRGLKLDGVNEYVNCGTSNTLSFNNGDNISIEAWIKPFNLSKQLHGIVDRYQSTQQRYSLYLTYKNIVFRFYNSGWHDYKTSFDPINNINKWYYVTLTYRYGIGSSARIFVNGDLKEGSWISGNGNVGPSSVVGENHIGTYGGVNSYSLQGIIDEVRISNVARTPEEIARNYQSGLVFRDGKVELDCWKYKRAITIENNGDTLTDYQIQVNLTKQDFDYSHAKDDGGDIRFYDGDGNLLCYWIEEWNTNSNSKIWVNVTNILNGGTRIWMYYGNKNKQSISDIERVFLFGEDGEDTSITSNLRVTKSGNSAITEANGVVNIDLGTNNVDAGMVASRNTLPMGKQYLIRQKIKQSSGTGGGGVFPYLFGVSSKSSSPNVASNGDIVGHRAISVQQPGTTYMEHTQGCINIRYYTNTGTIKIWDFDINQWKTQMNPVISGCIYEGTLNTYYFIEFISTSSAWHLKLYDQNNNLIETTTVVSWSSTRNVANGKYWYFTGSPETDFGYADFEIDLIIARKSSPSNPVISLSLEYENLAQSNLTSSPIALPSNNLLSTLSISKIEPANTYINLSVINAETNGTIPGFDNLTASNINLTSLNDLGITSIRLKAYFSGNGSATPSLDSWGVEWTAENAWRDSFIGNAKCIGTGGQLEADEHTVGLWHFDEGSGNVAKDFSGNGNDGTINGAQFVPGVIDKALEFDGTNDYVQVSDSPSLDINSQISMELWFYPKEPNLHHFLLDKLGTNNVRSYRLLVTGNGGTDSFGNDFVENSIEFGISHDNVNVIYLATKADHMVSVGKWNHLAATFNGMAMKIFLNGIKIAEGNSPGGIATNNNDLTIGTDYDIPGNSDYYSKGTIDEVRISNIARTPEEIHQAYQTGISIHGGQAQLTKRAFDPSADPSCIGYWSFDEGEGETAYDGSGNGNDGTLNDMTSEAWVSGISGRAIELSGGSDYVDFGDVDQYNFGLSDSFSVGGWFKTTNGNQQGFINKYKESGSNLGWWLFFNDANNPGLRFSIWAGDGSVSDIICNININDGQWHHFMGVRDVSLDKIFLYCDGIKIDDTEDLTTSSSENSYPFRIGQVSDSIKFPFIGTIDEVAIYDRALSHAELSAHYNFTSGRYPTNAILHSIPLTLPEDQSWSTFHCSRFISENTHLNISIHDAVTNEILHTNTNSTAEVYIDMMQIDPVAHPSIYLNASFEGNGTGTPVLYDWAVNWTDERLFHPPSLYQLIQNIEFPEDSLAENAVNLTRHFEDINIPAFSLSYGISNLMPDGKIQAIMNGSFVLFHTEKNWSGCENFTINCTNQQGLFTLSNVFKVKVTPVNDPPVWKIAPSPLEVMQGGSVTSYYILDDLVEDAEDDPWKFSALSEDVDVSITTDHRIHLNATGSFTGNTSVTVRVRESDNESLFSDIVIPVNVLANARPEVWLIEPPNGIIVADTSVELRWGMRDIDSPADNVTFDLYFGSEENNSLFASDIQVMNYTVTELEENTSYYWHVIPRDETGFGRCLNDTWYFIINTSKEVPLVSYRYPEDGITINTTTVNLSWKSLNLLDEDLSYEVFFGTDSNEGELTLQTLTSDKFCILVNLSDNMTYYWKVVPWAGKLQGRSESGVWSFSIDKTFVPIYNLTWSIDEPVLTIEKGITLSFALTLKNVGNTINTINIEKTGNITDPISLSRTLFSLKPNMNTTTIVNLFTYDLNVGNHKIVLILVHRGGTERIEIPVEITEIPPEEAEQSQGSGGYLIPSIISVLVLSLIIIAVFIILKGRKRKKKDREEDGNELYEADIVHVPTAGSKFAPPPLDNANMHAAPIPPLDPRYQFKGTATGMGAPAHVDYLFPHAPSSPVPAGPGDLPAAPLPKDLQFDTSGLHIPDENHFMASPVYGQGALLALPPARYLDLTEDQKIVPIDELFLMTTSGLLVQHYSLKRESGLNEDVLASMLTAVKSFILDSLSMVGEENVEEHDLSIDLGKFTVMMAAGRSLNLVAITGRDKKEQVRKQLEKGTCVLDVIFGDILESWDGDMSKLEGVKPYIESLVKGKFDDEMIKKMEKPLPPPEAPILPTPPEASPELPSGKRSVTVSLPDPVKLPDTTKALPERTDIPPEAPADETKGPDILSAIDDILGRVPESAGPGESGGETSKTVPSAAKPPILPGDEDMFRIPLDAMGTEKPDLPPPPGS